MTNINEREQLITTKFMENMRLYVKRTPHENKDNVLIKNAKTFLEALFKSELMDYPIIIAETARDTASFGDVEYFARLSPILLCEENEVSVENVVRGLNKLSACLKKPDYDFYENEKLKKFKKEDSAIFILVCYTSRDRGGFSRGPYSPKFSCFMDWRRNI